VKLKDHDLIGCPVRVVVGGKGLKEGIVEVKLRTAPKEGMEKVPVANVEARVLELVQGLLAQARSAADAIG
jgi:prolyl-tRNA synthetase